jgi:hypothetical protein
VVRANRIPGWFAETLAAFSCPSAGRLDRKHALRGEGEVHLPNVFSEHMLFQQGKRSISGFGLKPALLPHHSPTRAGRTFSPRSPSWPDVLTEHLVAELRDGRLARRQATLRKEIGNGATRRAHMS